jgi:hypothetical protein
MKKRIVMLLSVVALMVVMMVGSTVAFAAKPPSVNGCMVRGAVAFWITVNETDPRYRYDRNGDTYVCGYTKDFTRIHYTDNNH